MCTMLSLLIVCYRVYVISCVHLYDVCIHSLPLFFKGLGTVEVSATRTTIPISTHVCTSVAPSGEVTWKLLEQLATLCGAL